MRYDLAFEAEPFQGYTEFDELEITDTEGESYWPRDWLGETSKGSPISGESFLQWPIVGKLALRQPGGGGGGAVPAPATPPAPTIRSRPCCLLAPTVPFVPNNFLDPQKLGTHNGSDEAIGIIYTGKAGFVDLGHLRETCDLTKHIFDQMSVAATSAAPSSYKTIQGEATVKGALANTPLHIKVARAIAYEDAMGHEIWTYDVHTIGGHNSSFSPEDLCSNYMGTLVAELAINVVNKKAIPFETAVTDTLNSLLKSLDAQTQAESLAAFNRINNRWVKFTGLASLDDSYLRRRNFTRFPWKTGHKSDGPTPVWVTAGLGNLTGLYTYTNTLLRTFSIADYPAEVKAIKGKAKATYGENFDKP